MYFRLLVMALFYFASHCVQGAELIIYHDADYSGHTASAESMAMGFNTALAEVGNKVQGYEIKLVSKDHRGNVKRSLLTMKQFEKDPNALFVLGGLHSPPYISNLNFINENEILLLVPWAAGGPITRYSEGTNWVFRLSVDDTKAGYRLAEYASKQKQCKKPHLLLEETGWGKSNYKTLNLALKHLQEEPATTWFEWNTKRNVARIALRDAIASGSDCIIFVGNAIEGEVFTRAMLTFPEDQRLPFISHWGITGGDFHRIYLDYLRSEIDLSFIQTCYSFISSPASEHSIDVLKRASELYPGKITQAEDISAPPGFIHAYDLGRLVLAALGQVKLTGDIVKDRHLVRDALENIEKPVNGLIKTYAQPFEPWSADKPDAHEALQLADICMAKYNDQGHIEVIPNSINSD